MMSADTPTSFDLPSTARCRKCAYRLIGLCQARCPECGTDFDPLDASTFSIPRLVPTLRRFWNAHRRRIIPTALLGSVVFLQWLLFCYGGILTSVFWLPILLLVIHKRWLLIGAALAFSPFAILLAARCIDYAVGHTRYVRSGWSIIWSEQGNQRRDTGVRGFDPGCGTRSSDYWLRSLTERMAVPLMHAVIGPPPGAYTGPYPTLAECQTAMAAGGTTLLATEVEQGSFTLSGTRHTVLAEQLNHVHFQITDPDPGPAEAVLYQGQCLIVRTPRDRVGFAAVWHLFDTRTGKPFAVYFEPSEALETRHAP